MFGKSSQDVDKKYLHIRGISQNTTIEKLHLLFNQFEAKRITLQPTQQSNIQIANILFDNEHDSEIALDQMDGLVIDGQMMEIEYGEINDRENNDSQIPQTDIPLSNYKLLIKGLNVDTSRTEILDYFQQYEPTRIQLTQNTSDHENCFIISFNSKEKLDRAINEKQAQIVNSNKMKITEIQNNSRSISVPQHHSSNIINSFSPSTVSKSNIILSSEDLFLLAEPNTPTGLTFQASGFPRQLIPQFPKDQIEQLPRFNFEGKINMITTAEEAEQAVQILMKEDYLGFDTESEVNHVKRKQNQLRLIQIANKTEVWIFFVQSIKSISPLIPLFTSEIPQKACVAVKGDIKQLQSQQEFEPRGFVELTDLSKQLGIVDLGLQRLCANMLGIFVSKEQQLSDWSTQPLSQEQIVYAATDAWVSRWLLEAAFEYKKLGINLPPVVQKRAIDKNNPTLIVYYISENVSVEQLQQVFEQQDIHTIKVKIQKKISTVNQDGHEFKVKNGQIWLDDDQDILAAVDKMNNFDIDGVRIGVKGSKQKIRQKEENERKSEINVIDQQFRGVKMEYWSDDDEDEYDYEE